MGALALILATAFLAVLGLLLLIALRTFAWVLVTILSAVHCSVGNYLLLRCPIVRPWSLRGGLLIRAIGARFEGLAVLLSPFGDSR